MPACSPYGFCHRTTGEEHLKVRSGLRQIQSQHCSDWPLSADVVEKVVRFRTLGFCVVYILLVDVRLCRPVTPGRMPSASALPVSGGSGR